MSRTREHARRRQQAHDASVRENIHEIAGFLQEIFGQKLVAHMAGVADYRRVGEWTDEVTPNPRSQTRLRTAYRVAWMLLEEDEAEIVRAWFIGLNPQLDDTAPADALRDDRFKDVIDAADAFLAGG